MGLTLLNEYMSMVHLLYNYVRELLNVSTYVELYRIVNTTTPVKMNIVFIPYRFFVGFYLWSCSSPLILVPIEGVVLDHY